MRYISAMFFLLACVFVYAEDQQVKPSIDQLDRYMAGACAGGAVAGIAAVAPEKITGKSSGGFRE